MQRRYCFDRIVPTEKKDAPGDIQMDDNYDSKKEIEEVEATEETEPGNEDPRRWRIFMIFVLIGFALIFIIVPRVYTAIAVKIGWTKIRAIPILLIALFWYIWGQVCLYIKNKYNID